MLPAIASSPQRRGDRPGLAGEKRLVDLGVAFEQAAVGWKRLAGQDPDAVAALKAV